MRTGILRIAVAALAIVAISARAWTIFIIDEDFQTPLNPSTVKPPNFAGWAYSGSGGMASRGTHTSADVPGTYPSPTNQLLHFEWDGSAWYDTTHAWSLTYVYELSMNLSQQEWPSLGTVRWFHAKIKQTDGTLLWNSGTNFIALYDNHGRQPWQPECFHSFTIPATNFTGGTEGSLLRLEIVTNEGGGQRGVYLDNVQLSYIPPPSGTVIRLK